MTDPIQDTRSTTEVMVLALDDPAADLLAVGGKGAALARLARAGLPVPPGFHITTAAYRAFLFPDTRLGDPAAFIRSAMPPSVATAVEQAYAALGGGAVAVRSSATAEDLADLSFAGQHDSFLGVVGTAAVLDAVRRCWASLWTDRAVAYRARHGVSEDGLALAVVVQRMVRATAAGVLFTANPLSGDPGESVVNAAWGLGEAVVGGRVTPDVYVVAGGGEVRREIADKVVMTVPTAAGAEDVPVPEPLRRAAALDTGQVLDLVDLGARVRELYGVDVDIEWARHAGGFALLQARPITTQAAEVWNDTLSGDYLWSSANLGEAIPSVMTPATWSLVRSMPAPALGPHPSKGNIGGRGYLNLSVPLAVGSALGLGRPARRAVGRLFGRIPGDVEVPPLPMGRWEVLRAAARAAIPFARQGRDFRRRLPELLARTPGRCAALRERIARTGSAGELLALWRSDVDTLLRVDCATLDAGGRTARAGERIAARLRRIAPEDADLLTTGLHNAEDGLASLGPLLGLARLRAGEIDRETYARQWGHRCADEYEVSVPRPLEDPAWIDRALAAPGDPLALLDRQDEARERAWERFAAAHPRRAPGVRRALDRAAEVGRGRERARSEMVRTFSVFRAFIVRAGELTGHGDDLFMLPIEDILIVLTGDDAPLKAIPARKAAYRLYRSLPPYPTLISGRFDPVAWAATARETVGEGVITGFPGMPGVISGIARVVSTLEAAEALQEGEVLVAPSTNVGWTPMFPRAAAIVTDVGAPLSHAAVVARELGIPAVVGCGDATSRLRTGDLVRVDGARGTVELTEQPGDGHDAPEDNN
ncbi:PEP/pyruvate-binding domain-containing protein [Actinokineospora diospyrosa]|uniref:Pyruvate, water dikinase n=1 Tax=Actinokineospora diospyrosa TaxID=103728 RepID=A0ABT1I6L0_9PSEU|nr:PEP/pyruvate-binding domain-containing protein [Actinokineospora diospyrosa]MCP2268270.1 pyruvate, water dikinase [Actinokineospora diospyrosa]